MPKNGLSLWVNNVVPSLLPFLICINVLKKTNIINIIGKLLEPFIRPLFNVPGCGTFAIVMGMSSGYPIGAQFAASLREENKCSKIEGERLLAFTNTSGPLFIIGAVGIGMFANSQIGFLLLITHFIAALIVGILFRFYKNTTCERMKIFENSNKNKHSNSVNLSNIGTIMGDAIRKSISTLLLICGFIVFFCVLGTILDSSGITAQISNIISKLFVWLGFSENIIDTLSAGCFKGILEITNGLKILSNSNMDFKVLLPICATILGFGGISVHMQVASIISSSDLSIKPYLLGKTLHGLFSGILTYLILNHTKFVNLETVETFSNSTLQGLNNTNILNLFGSGNLLLIALACIVLVLLIKLLFSKSTYITKKDSEF